MDLSARTGKDTALYFLLRVTWHVFNQWRCNTWPFAWRGYLLVVQIISKIFRYFGPELCLGRFSFRAAVTIHTTKIANDITIMWNNLAWRCHILLPLLRSLIAPLICRMSGGSKGIFCKHLNFFKTLSDRYGDMFIPTLVYPEQYVWFSKGLRSLRDAYGN